MMRCPLGGVVMGAPLASNRSGTAARCLDLFGPNGMYWDVMGGGLRSVLGSTTAHQASQQTEEFHQECRAMVGGVLGPKK